MFKMYEFSDQDYTNHVSFDRHSDENEDTWWNFNPLTYIDLSSNLLQEVPKEIEMFGSLETCLVS